MNKYVVGVGHLSQKESFAMKNNKFSASVIIVALATTLLACSGVAAAPRNFVYNGDFEAGNFQFTSDYTFRPGGNFTEGEYTVSYNPVLWNVNFVSIGDHTSGSDRMMVANGSPVSGAVVWKSQSISVVAATNYFFEAFVNNVCCQGFTFGPGSESILEFSLRQDGGAAISLGTITTNLALAGTWEGLSTQYLSSTPGFVELSLINRNTNRGGNDFAVDDVFFGTESTVIPVPEPQTIILVGIGLAAFLVARGRQRGAGKIGVWPTTDA